MYAKRSTKQQLLKRIDLAGEFLDQVWGAAMPLEETTNRLTAGVERIASAFERIATAMKNKQTA